MVEAAGIAAELAGGGTITAIGWVGEMAGDMEAGDLDGRGWVSDLGSAILTGLTRGGVRGPPTDTAMHIPIAMFMDTLIPDTTLRMTTQISHRKETIRIIRTTKTIRMVTGSLQTARARHPLQIQGS